MSEYLPKEVRAGLELARKTNQKKKCRMRVRAGGQDFTLLRYWDDGFALDMCDAPSLRGLVDVYNGANHVSQCLIVASSEQAGEMVYEFKRATSVLDKPPLDYSPEPDAPVALIEKY